jgi:hypothetical protein
MTWADYPQFGQVARGPRSIFPLPKTVRILRAARDMNTIMADHHPIRPITGDEYPRFRRVGGHAFYGGQDNDVRLARWVRQ